MNRKAPKQSGLHEWCQSRLASVVSEGLPPLPECVFDLDVLLSAPVMDLKKITRALGSDNKLAQRVLHLSNTTHDQSGDSATNIPEAVVLLGPGLFHAAVLISAVTGFGPEEFRTPNAEMIWTHSVLMAALSERIAQLSEYPHRGMAFVAGLLHDIGHLPFLMVAREHPIMGKELDSIFWRDNIELEREIFGLDHCELGRWMGMTWEFLPSLMDAVKHHHDPRKAVDDPQLAEIVSAAEHFCSRSLTVTNPERTTESAWDGVGFTEHHAPVHRIGNPLHTDPSASFVWALRADLDKAGGKRFRN